ncbi:MAG: glycosyltransferase [Ignavibacteria bacterium]|jgi:glycosyltransferase involved in cell wall biosynthesis
MNDILVIIPARNEEKTIFNVVKGIYDSLPDVDIIVIDDNSNDYTAKYARNAKAKVFSLPFPSEGGANLILLMYLITLKYDYKYLLKIDGDGQHMSTDLIKIKDELIKNKYDVVVGSRYIKDGVDEENGSIIKKIGRLYTQTFLNSFLKNNIVYDPTSGLRGWSRGCLKKLVSYYLDEKSILPEDTIFWPLEILLCDKMNIQICEVPITVKKREFGNSKSFTNYRMLKYFMTLSYNVFLFRKS